MLDINRFMMNNISHCFHIVPNCLVIEIKTENLPLKLPIPPSIYYSPPSMSGLRPLVP